jgi:hypothetical protein
VSQAPQDVAALFEHAVRAPDADHLDIRLVKVLESIVFSDNTQARRSA